MDLRAHQEAAARRVVGREIDALPPELAPHARRVAVLLRDASTEEDHPDVPAGELLGLFSGLSYGEGEPQTPDDVPRITLFLETLWEEAGGDPETFEREVRTTYLHELGHYFGWDEDDLAQRRLD